MGVAPISGALPNTKGSMTKNYIIALADKIASGIATDDEIAAYNVMYNSLQARHDLQPEEKSAMEAQLRERILQKTKSRPAIRTMHWWQWAAAAVVLFAVAGAFFFRRPAQKATMAVKPATTQPANINPGTQKALLTLANGNVVVLDSNLNGTFAIQGNMRVTRQNGRLQYIAAADKAAQPAEVYNTITTPRGGQYQLVLGDGTKVWLNAASLLRFPAGFTGATRDVEIKGEAYFEVAKDAAHPFRVFAGGAVVRVLGTHFNINAYDDENTIATTLLEGSVKMVKNEAESILKPGDQAQLDKSGRINLLHDVNVQQVVAWKDGFFQFDNAGIKTVMRQLSRWYDVEVEYRGAIDPAMSFDGKMGRDLRLQQVLKILQKSEVHFAIEGRNIIVVP